MFIRLSYKLLIIFILLLLSRPAIAEDNAVERLNDIKLYIKSNELDNGRFNSVIYIIDSLIADGNPKETEILATINQIGHVYRQQGQLTEAMEFYRTMISLYEDIKKPTHEEMRSHAVLYIPMGATHEEMGMWNRAMDYYMIGLTMAEKYDFENVQAMIYNNIGAIHFNQWQEDNLDKAEYYFNQALEINKKTGNKFEMFTNYNNLGEVYMERKDYKKALDYSLIGIQQIDREQNPYYYYFMQTNIGHIYYLMGDYKMALSYLQNAARHQQELEHISHLNQTYITLYKTFRGAGIIDSAKYYMELSLQLAKELENNYIESMILKDKAELSFELHQYSEAYQSLRASTLIDDSIARIDNQQRMELIETMLSAETGYKKNLSLKEKTAEYIEEHPILMLFLAFCLLLVLVFIVIVFRTKRNARLLKDRLRTEKQLIESIENERKRLQEKESELQLEIDKQNRELTTSALSTIQSSELFEGINEELKKLFLEVGSLKNRTPRDRVKSIMNQLNAYNFSNNWVEFQYYFEKVHPSFYKKLDELFPNLTTKEQQLCSLLQLGLSSKEISAITFKEVRSVESSRNRLRKKLGITPDVDIVEFLRGITKS